MDEHGTELPRRRRPRLRGWRIPALILLILIIGAAIAVWVQRIDIATGYIDRELERRGVQATYEVRRIGFRTQIFENLVIGDPRRPDATAKHVEVQILFGLTGPRVGLITARGVRMFGRLREGRLTLGQIDRLLPPPSGLPFRLPDQRIDIADSAIVIDTPNGLVALALDGRGNLSDGFQGELAGIARELNIVECRLDRTTANFRVSVNDLEPTFRGPIGLQSLRCGDDLLAVQPLFNLDVTMAAAFDAWRGGGEAVVERFQAGPQYLETMRGRLTFTGDALRTRGSFEVRTGRGAVDAFLASRTALRGRYAISPRHGDLRLIGQAGAGGVRIRDADLANLAGMVGGFGGTPLEPIGDALAAAVTRAGRSGAGATARVQLVNYRGTGAIRLDDLRVRTASGARLTGERVTYHWPRGLMQLDGAFALAGGGFPDARFVLNQARAGAPLEGRGRIEAMRVGSTRLAINEVRFAAGADGRTRFATAVALDGPFDGGRVTGLVMPVRGRFGPDGWAVGEGCVTARWTELRIEDLRIGPTRLPLCPATGPALAWQRRGGPLQAGAEIRGTRLAGRLGAQPFRLVAGRLRATDEGIRATNLAVLVGPGGAAHRLEIESLSGSFGRGVSGNFAGLSGQIANVPFLISEGRGRWQVRDGDVLVQGRVRVADARDPVRFYPLVSDDFRLTLIDNRIHATGWLEHPDSGTRVTHATIDHNLRTGAGQALLDVPGITFGETLQPEQLTPLTLGVVSLVEGTVSGEGRIEWDEAGTRSTGTFTTQDLDFAAAFGPVEGLATTIEFTDLLGLVSAPGQVARVRLVRPGIDIYDGTITYHLQANYHVAIESGRWPFMGGELVLEPTLLDFSQPSTKFLTFRIIGLDAATFVQQMEFGNIAATGTFDGVVPMRFDQSGGHVVGGRLSARPPGGTLSYVGELTDRDLGLYGKIAFDALKELRYARFDLTLDGALSGEFFTNIELDGVARQPTATLATGRAGGIFERIASGVVSQLAALPFEFNIRIQGPFRALIATARSFKDPSDLIQPVLPAVLRDLPTTVIRREEEQSETQSEAPTEPVPETPPPDVQQEESENRP